MNWLNRFYLDKEKDIIVDLYQDGEELSYVLSTPNHGTGNLITNLAKLCDLPLTMSAQGLKIIEGKVPCYVDGYNRKLYIFRLGGTKVANIFPDGSVEMKAQVPAISKTLMSQTKDYRLNIEKTIVKTYLRSECKFRTDLHTHMNANLSPDVLIALGILHQIRYPLYYIKKLGLRLTAEQKEVLAARREKAEEEYADCGLTGKYLVRRIDDNTFLNFADLILNNFNDASYNIPRIRASLAVMKDGQAVFTNLEKVYLYRYVFTKGVTSEDLIPVERDKLLRIPDADIAAAAVQMVRDRETACYAHNTLFQDKLLWIARGYAAQGIQYAEISDTTLVKKEEAPRMLAQVHEVMPAVTRETGVTLRFLAAIRRIPLTIVKDKIVAGDYFRENIETLRAVAMDPYVAGSDIVGEEINDIRELRPVMDAIVKTAAEDPSYVIRIHAGENDSLRDNVTNSIRMIREALAPGQKMPHFRIGHGLYTPSLNTAGGRELVRELRDNHVVLEFQITSNVRLNNLSDMENHPLRRYLQEGIYCVQGTDGGALYGTDSIDEQLSLEKMLGLTYEEMLQMRASEEIVSAVGLAGMEEKAKAFAAAAEQEPAFSVQEFYEKRIAAQEKADDLIFRGKEGLDAQKVFAERIEELPQDGLPVVVVGGSFNNDRHTTRVLESNARILDELLEKGDPSEIYFVIGHRMSGYERYLVEKNQGRFRIYAMVPTVISEAEARRLSQADVRIRIAIGPEAMGIYKSLAYEIFKRRPSVLLALDGNSAGANMIQEAKNSKYRCRTFVSRHSRALRMKAVSLEGYVTIFGDDDAVSDEILAFLREIKGE